MSHKTHTHTLQTRFRCKKPKLQNENKQNVGAYCVHAGRNVSCPPDVIVPEHGCECAACVLGCPCGDVTLSHVAAALCRALVPAPQHCSHSFQARCRCCWLGVGEQRARRQDVAYGGGCIATATQNTKRAHHRQANQPQATGN